MAASTGEPQDVGEVLGTEHIMLRWLSSSELSPDRYHFFASETGNARKGPPVIFHHFFVFLTLSKYSNHIETYGFFVIESLSSRGE